jgi:hypothetical protein
MEGQGILVFVYLVAGDFTPDDPGKNVVWVVGHFWAPD